MKVNILSIIIKQISSTTVREQKISQQKKKKKKIGGLLFLRKAWTNQSLLNKTKGKPNHWADKSWGKMTWSRKLTKSAATIPTVLRARYYLNRLHTF